MFNGLQRVWGSKEGMRRKAKHDDRPTGRRDHQSYGSPALTLNGWDWVWGWMGGDDTSLESNTEV